MQETANSTFRSDPPKPWNRARIWPTKEKNISILIRLFKGQSRHTQMQTSFIQKSPCRTQIDSPLFCNSFILITDYKFCSRREFMQVRSGSSTIHTWRKKKATTNNLFQISLKLSAWLAIISAGSRNSYAFQTNTLKCFLEFWLWQSLCEPPATQDRSVFESYAIKPLLRQLRNTHQCWGEKLWTQIGDTQLGREGWHHSLLWETIFRSYFLLLLVLIGQKKSTTVERLIRVWAWKTQALNKH